MTIEKPVNEEGSTADVLPSVANEQTADVAETRLTNTHVTGTTVGSRGPGSLGTGTDYVIYHDHRVEAPGQLTGLSVSSVGSVASEDGGIGNIFTVTVPSPDAVLQADALTCSFAPELSARMSFVLRGAEGEGTAARRQADVLALLERSKVTGAQALRFYPVENLRAIQGSELVYPLERAEPGATLNLPEGLDNALDHSVLRPYRAWVHSIVTGLLHDPLNPEVDLFRTSAHGWAVLIALGLAPDDLHIRGHYRPDVDLTGVIEEGEDPLDHHLLADYTPTAPEPTLLTVGIDDVVSAIVDTIMASRIADLHAASADTVGTMGGYSHTLGDLRGLFSFRAAFAIDEAEHPGLPTQYRRIREQIPNAAVLVADENSNLVHWCAELGYYVTCEHEGAQVNIALNVDGRMSQLRYLPGAIMSYGAIARHEHERGYEATNAVYAANPASGTILTPESRAKFARRSGRDVDWLRPSTLSNEFFILPVSADVTGRVAQAIADYFIAVRLIQLFPDAALWVRDISRIPMTAEEIEGWLHQPLIRLDIRNVENIRGTYAGGRDTCFNTSYAKYVAPLAQLSDKEALERPELIAIRARAEFDRMEEYLASDTMVYNGQLVPAHCPVGLARDVRLQRFVPWVKVMRQVMNTPAELNRANRDADSRLRQANAYAEAMDCYCALEPYMLSQSVASKAFARNVRVDSAVPNHFTIAGQDVVFAQSYITDDQISLGNSTRITYIRPDYQHTGDARLSVDAAPGRRGISHGLHQQVCIRTQKSAEHQLNWINVVTSDTGFTTEQFTRCYQIMVEQVVPTTVFGSNFRPWRPNNNGLTWAEQLMQRTAVGRLTRVINTVPGLAQHGVSGMVFPVTIGSCQSGAIQAHFINNNFQVKVLNDSADICATPGAVFAYDVDGRPSGELSQRLHTMQPMASTYPLPQDTARY